MWVLGVRDHNLPSSNPLLLPKLSDFTSVPWTSSLCPGPPVHALIHTHSWLFPPVCRNRANAVEGSVEEVLGTLQRAHTVLLEAQGALRGSGSSLRFIQERVDEVRDARSQPEPHPRVCPAPCPAGFGVCVSPLTGSLCPQIEAVLGPAESSLGAVGAGLAGLEAQLERLQRGAEQNLLRAGDTRDTAGTAAQRASSAQQVRAELCLLLERHSTALPWLWGLSWAGHSCHIAVTASPRCWISPEPFPILTPFAGSSFLVCPAWGRAARGALSVLELITKCHTFGNRDTALVQYIEYLTRIQHWQCPSPQAAGCSLQSLFAFPQAFAQVKELYSELQSRMGQGLELGEQGRRVQSIGQEAQALFQETMGIMLRMESKALTASSCPGEELGGSDEGHSALWAVTGWALGCAWWCCTRKSRVFWVTTMKGSPACSATLLPFSSTPSLPFAGIQNKRGWCFGGGLEGGEQRECRILVFLPCQSEVEAQPNPTM